MGWLSDYDVRIANLRTFHGSIMSTKTRIPLAIAIVTAALSAQSASRAEEPNQLRKALTFHASFDESADADKANGDAKVYTSETLKREKVRTGLPTDAVALAAGGRFGKCLSFSKKTPQLVFYRGADNIAYDKQSMNGAVSLWMELDPATELPAGYVDPLQITDKKWNDASLFLDFTQKNPRSFRLGVYSDFKFWNPTNRKFAEIPAEELPLVSLSKAPFQRKRWTHVAFTLSNFNSSKPGEAVLYIDGRQAGVLKGKQRFTWNPQDVVVMIGIYYVGRMDDLAIFDRTLTPAQIKEIGALPNGVRGLYEK